jgi:carboxyl-terminal processing protease
MYKLFPALFYSFVILSSSAYGASRPPTTIVSLPTDLNAAKSNISFDESHSKTLIDIIDNLSENHFRRQPFDDKLSSAYLDNLIKALDPNHFYFTQAEIDSFNDYRYSFDDSFSNGNLDAAGLIVSRYFSNSISRLESNISILSQVDDNFDFTTNELFNIDYDEQSWAANKSELDLIWSKRLKSNVLSFMLDDKTQAQAKQALHKRYSNQLKRLQEQDSTEIFELLINALTELYDPHTSYFAPRTSESFNISMSLSLEGIGAVLQSDEGYTKVVRIIKAGPADKQGDLKPADRITAVAQGFDDFVDVVDWQLDDVVDLIRGPKNTVVRLKVLPSSAVDASESTQIEIRREKVKLEEQAAQKGILELSDGKGGLYKIGVINLPTFYVDFEAYRRQDPDFKSTTRDVFRLLRELKQDGVQGLIIDLRGNGGGSLQEAAMLTDLFIDPGPVVQIRQTNNYISRNYKSRGPAVYRGPLVVLTNRLSASASEIFAGAIQDYKRGLIVGGQTFGKGTVQSLMPVHNGQLKLTESKFYRVSGGSTQHRGVVPDISFPFLVDIDEVGESSYETALPWDSIHAINHPAYFDFSSIIDSLIQKHNQRTDTDPDFLFLKDQMEIALKNKERKTISLNKTIRENELNTRKENALNRENIRRQAKGQNSYTSIEDWEKESKAKAEQNKLKPESAVNDEDAYLSEAGYILIDMIQQFDHDKQAKLANF